MEKIGFVLQGSLCIILMLILEVSGPYACAQSQPAASTPQTKQDNQKRTHKPLDNSLLKNQKDQENYAIGVYLISNLKKQGVKIDLGLVVKGMQDAMSGEKLLLSDGELQNAITLYQREVRSEQGKMFVQAAANNKKQEETFFSENMKREGVVSLPSGLQYQVIKAGDGKKPTPAESVECRYRGMFLDGKEFDNSNHTGNPVVLKVGDLVPGLQEALQLMPVGSNWKIFIPSHLAYGEKGASATIGPNTTLVFEIELLAIK